MPYKSQEARKEASRKSMAKKRGINIEGLTKEGLTGEGLTEYHSIMSVLIDPVKREKLQRICDSLRRRGLLREVYYGMRCPLDFGTVSDLLEATL